MASGKLEKYFDIFLNLNFYYMKNRTKIKITKT